MTIYGNAAYKASAAYRGAWAIANPGLAAKKAAWGATVGAARLGAEGLWHGTAGAAKLSMRAIQSAQKGGLPQAAWGAAKFGYSPLNKLSNIALGGSIPQIAVGAGIGIGLFSYFSNNPVETARDIGGSLREMGTAIRGSNAKSYGQTVFQQSAQGLTFGLNSRRTR